MISQTILHQYVCQVLVNGVIGMWPERIHRQDGASRGIILLSARIRHCAKRTPRGQDRQSHGDNGKRRNVSQ